MQKWDYLTVTIQQNITTMPLAVVRIDGKHIYSQTLYDRTTLDKYHFDEPNYKKHVSFSKFIKFLGEEGWELVSSTPIIYSLGNYEDIPVNQLHYYFAGNVSLVFKRPKE